jgi:TPR repeat protein
LFVFKRKKFCFIVIVAILQFSLFKVVYAGEVDAKKCSNSINDRLIYRDAQSGDVEAQYFLGNKLFSATCTSDEQERGLLLLMRAAQSDHPGALFVLGYMLFENAHNDREVYDALKHLKKSSQLGHHPAQSYLGSILLNNAISKKEKRKALDLLKTAALAGSIDAARILYHIYFSGLYEEKKNLCIANFWFALTLKKDSFKHDFLGAKVTDCFDDERVTFSE